MRVKGAGGKEGDSDRHTKTAGRDGHRRSETTPCVSPGEQMNYEFG